MVQRQRVADARTVALSSVVDGLGGLCPESERGVVVDTGEVADALPQAFILALRTDPEMNPDRPMHWDTLVDGVSYGFDLPPFTRQRLALLVGPSQARPRHASVPPRLGESGSA